MSDIILIAARSWQWAVVANELWAAEIQIILIVFGTNITLFRNNSIFIQSIK